MIRPVQLKDASALADLYNYYVINTTITFEETPINKEEMGNRIQNHSPEHHWMVVDLDNKIVGFAFANSWKNRSAYRFTKEISVYVAPDHQRNGWGKQLYTKLLMILQKEGIHTVLAGITIPNESSIRFHESMGFEKVAHFKETGFKLKKWLDIGYWEKKLDN